jgi:hypothetical protein
MLNTQAHTLAYDDFYEALIGAHQGLSNDDSHALNARLVLLLANHIGDLAVLRSALQLARGSQTPRPSSEAQAISPVAPVHAQT